MRVLSILPNNMTHSIKNEPNIEVILKCSLQRGSKRTDYRAEVRKFRGHIQIQTMFMGNTAKAAFVDNDDVLS